MIERPDVTIRPFVETDVEPVAEIMRATWAGDVERAVGRVASLALLGSYLSEHDWGLVAVEDNRVVGAVLAGLRHTDRSDRWSALVDAAMDEARLIDPSLPELLRAEGDVEAEEARVTKALKAGDLPQADATIQLLVLAEEARGRHIGARLFEDARAWMGSKGARGYFLMTDDACDVSFYDHAGLERLSTGMVLHHGSPISVYAYGELL